MAAVAYSAYRPNGTVSGKYPQFLFIDREGNVAIDTYDWLLPIGFVRGSFNEGLIAVMYREYIFEEFREKWAYMNMDGELIGDGHCFL
ncbi:hypothetical protein FACS189490_11920 [Clostridia bacterium]|nr:hypothetical protein FACS189490_11920 [Clostridia bacterium]